MEADGQGQFQRGVANTTGRGKDQQGGANTNRAEAEGSSQIQTQRCPRGQEGPQAAAGPLAPPQELSWGSSQRWKAELQGPISHWKHGAIRETGFINSLVMRLTDQTGEMISTPPTPEKPV